MILDDNDEIVTLTGKDEERLRIHSKRDLKKLTYLDDSLLD